jgi:hypothetical protein
LSSKTKEQKNLQGKECVQMSHDYLGFEESLEEDDYGFILDKEGNLKGMWIPESQEENDVPAAIVELLKRHWGVDITDDSVYGTIH